MAMYQRYTGEFMSRAGVLWRCDIMQQSLLPFDVGELTFEADEALVMEWDEVAPHETICSSSATLKIESMTDRAYVDLYTEEVGSVRLDVYREGELYWQGCLDTEFYEEPYERLQNYAVTLTFSDFGVWDRLKFNLGSGITNLQAILLDALARAGLTYGADGITCTSSTFLPENGGTTPFDPWEIGIQGADFYDEEDEPSTLKEVLDGLLQPLALKIIQRNGRIYIYDLNWAWYNAAREEVWWSSTSQTLGVSDVYNNAIVTFSPYADSTESEEDVFDEDAIDQDRFAGDYILPKPWDTDPDFWTVGYDLFQGWFDIFGERTDVLGQGFMLWLNDMESTYNYQSTDYATAPNHDEGAAIETSWQKRVTYFWLRPFYLGDEAQGLAIRYAHAYTTDEGMNSGQIVQMGVDDGVFSGSIRVYTQLFRSAEYRLNTVADPSQLLVRITVELLCSARLNPWIEMDDDTPSSFVWSHHTYKDNDDKFNDQCQCVTVPVKVMFRTDDGEWYAWTNSPGLNETGVPTGSMNIEVPWQWSESLGAWQTVSGSDATVVANAPVALLAYYTPSNMQGDSGVAHSFSANHQYTGLMRRTPIGIKEAETAGDGQFIKYPDCRKPGSIFIVPLGGWHFLRYEESSKKWWHTDEDAGVMEHTYWALMKLPQFEVTTAKPWNLDLPTDDIEYNACINEDAKEDLEISTICGTGGVNCPTARGAFLNPSGYFLYTKFLREELEGTCEELLIATLYSQYATRHTKLSGECRISDTTGVVVYTDPNQEGLLFLPTARVEDAIEDTCDITLVELSYDDYEPDTDE